LHTTREPALAIVVAAQLKDSVGVFLEVEPDVVSLLPLQGGKAGVGHDAVEDVAWRAPGAGVLGRDNVATLVAPEDVELRTAVLGAKTDSSDSATGGSFVLAPATC
jgi:hypothetical protein